MFWKTLCVLGLVTVSLSASAQATTTDPITTPTPIKRSVIDAQSEQWKQQATEKEMARHKKRVEIISKIKEDQPLQRRIKENLMEKEEEEHDTNMSKIENGIAELRPNRNNVDDINENAPSLDIQAVIGACGDDAACLLSAQDEITARLLNIIEKDKCVSGPCTLQSGSIGKSKIPGAMPPNRQERMDIPGARAR